MPCNPTALNHELGLNNIKMKRRAKEIRGGYSSGITGKDDAATISGIDVFVSANRKFEGREGGFDNHLISLPKTGHTGSGQLIVSESTQTPPLAALFSLQNHPSNLNGRGQKDSHPNVTAERRFFDQVWVNLLRSIREKRVQ